MVYVIPTTYNQNQNKKFSFPALRFFWKAEDKLGKALPEWGTIGIIQEHILPQTTPVFFRWSLEKGPASDIGNSSIKRIFAPNRIYMY